jgi:hypothetical protein
MVAGSWKLEVGSGKSQILESIKIKVSIVSK